MDATRFKEIFLPCHRQVYAIAYRLLGNVQDAQDMTQETYARLWEQREKLASLDTPAAYAATVVRNLCIDHLRSNPPATYDVEQLATPPAATDTPHSVTEMHDNMHMLHGLIARLPQSQRRAIVLHDMQGYSDDEIVSITGWSAVNLRVTLSRARKHLREEYRKIMSYGDK